MSDRNVFKSMFEKAFANEPKQGQCEWDKYKQKFIPLFNKDGGLGLGPSEAKGYESADDVEGRGEATGGALKALQMAYLYHCMDDDEIGSSELGDTLLDAICNIMGDNAYQQWADSNHQRIRGDG